MDREELRDDILFRLTGGVLACELPTSAIDRIINMGIKELRRYYDVTTLVTRQYSSCMDVRDLDANAILRVFRAQGFTDATGEGSSAMDPMLASQWQLLNGNGNLNNFSDFAYNYAAWNTLMQIRNTTSTDLAFRYDKQAEKLYINISSAIPTSITIEYIKRLTDVSEITSDFWIDNLSKLCVALAKITIGTVRSRFTQSNGLWSNDGAQQLEEGNAQLTEIRTFLQTNTNLMFPID